MADLTLKQAKDYVRSKVKELKNDALVDNMLTIDFSLAQVKVQSDLAEVGIKEFDKTAILSGPRALLPSDIMPVPNAVKDVRAATGERAYIATNLTDDANNDLLFTAVEPGTPGNGIKVVYNDDGSDPLAVTSVDFSGANPIINIGFSSGLPDEEITAQMVMDAINNHPTAASLVTASLKTGNDGTGPIAANTVTLANGTGGGWKPADERTVKDSNRMEDNYIEAASSSFPKYVLKGNTDQNRMIEIYPKTVKYIEILYDYTIAEMTEDTDTLTIPLQYRELVLIEVIRKAYESLDMIDKMATRTAEYNAKISKIHENYQMGLQSSLSDKLRMEKQD